MALTALRQLIVLLSSAPPLFVFGLVVGSFLNVVISRYDPDRGFFNFSAWRGRSHCPECKATLRWFELIPVLSFLFQRGFCRHCGKKISWQYPLVELFTGFIFLLPIYFISTPNQQLLTSYFLLPTSIIWLLVFLVFLLIAVIDYRLYLIPNELNWMLWGLGFFRVFLESQRVGGTNLIEVLFLVWGTGLSEVLWLMALGGAVVGLGITGFIVLITGGRGMGLGDVKLMGALGLLFGFPKVIFIFVIASFLGAVAGIYLLLRGRKTLKSHLPFGPFLILASVIVFFLI